MKKTLSLFFIFMLLLTSVVSALEETQAPATTAEKEGVVTEATWMDKFFASFQTAAVLAPDQITSKPASFGTCSYSRYKVFTQTYNYNDVVGIGTVCADNSQIRVFLCRDGVACTDRRDQNFNAYKVNGVLPKITAFAQTTYYRYDCYDCQTTSSTTTQPTTPKYKLWAYCSDKKCWSCSSNDGKYCVSGTGAIGSVVSPTSPDPCTSNGKTLKNYNEFYTSSAECYLANSEYQEQPTTTQPTTPTTTQPTTPTTTQTGCCKYPALFGLADNYACLSGADCSAKSGAIVDGSQCEYQIDTSCGTTTQPTTTQPTTPAPTPKPTGTLDPILFERFTSELSYPTDKELLDAMCTSTTECKTITGYKSYCVTSQNYKAMFGTSLPKPITSKVGEFFLYNTGLGGSQGVCIAKEIVVEEDNEQSCPAFISDLPKNLGGKADCSQGWLYAGGIAFLVLILVMLIPRGK